MKSMKDQYGSKRGEQVFYASMNKGKIKGVEKKKNGGLGQKSGPPPKKGPASQGIKVLKLRGGGMDMGNAANQAQSASMGTSGSKSSNTSSGGSGGNRPNPHTTSGTSRDTPITQRQLQLSRNFQQQQKDRAGKRALDTAQVKKIPPFTPGAFVLNAAAPLRQKGFEYNKSYFRKNVVGKGYKDTLDDYKKYMRGRGQGTLDAMGREIARGDNRPDATSPSSPSMAIVPTKASSTSTVPIPLMKVQPKTFDFEYKEGGLVRGSGKVLKGKVKKAKIY